MNRQFRTIGTRLRRPDAGPRLTGHERYTDDLWLPGMLHAHLVFSIEAHAEIRCIRTEAACVCPGVVSVMTAADLPSFAQRDDPPERHQFFLASQFVTFVGQPVAVIIAESAATAELAADLVEVEYDPQPAVTSALNATSDLASAVRVLSNKADGREPHIHPNVSGAVHHQRGDAERAFREAAVVVGRTFYSHSVHQSYLEPRSVVAAADPTGKITVWTATQGQFMVRSAVSEVLGIPETDIHVEPMTVGGGFGAKWMLFEPLVALLAQLLDRPIKLTLTRQQDFVGTTPAPESVLHVALAANDQGNFTGIRADLTFNTGYFSKSPYQNVGLMIGSYYFFPAFDITSREVFTNRTGAGSYRAPGMTPMVFALESLVDDVALQLGLNPIEIRMRNVAGTGAPMADGQPWPSFNLKLVLQELENSSFWTEPCEAGEGIGVALGVLRGSTDSASAGVRLNADGTLQVIVGSIDITGTTTGFTQIAADTFGVSPELITVTTAPTDSAPHAGGSGGSKILYTVGNAVAQAAEDARSQVLAIAAEELEVGINDLEIVDDRVTVRGAGDHHLLLTQIHQRTSGMESKHRPVFGHSNLASPTRSPSVVAHLARVTVDSETGEVYVTGYLAVHDVGRAINPAEVEAQVHGGVAQGIGWGLFESLVYDESGQLLSSSFMDYALPRAKDIPNIETRILEDPSPLGPFGAKGVGEPPVIPPAAAIANAIANATGLRLTELPMTSQGVWEALKRVHDRPSDK